MISRVYFIGVVCAWIAWGAVAEETGDERDWHATVYGGLRYSTGNTEESVYQYGGEYDKKDDDTYRYKLKLDGKYRETEGNVNSSKVDASGEMRRKLNPRWFVSGTVSGLHDGQKDLSYRTKIGPGLGLYFKDSEKLTADLSTGLSYVREKTAEGVSDYLGWRLSQWFNWKATETLRWWFSTELFLDTSATSDWQLTFKSGIDQKINSHFGLITVVENEYDHRPEDENLKQNDFEVSVGLRYTF